MLSNHFRRLQTNVCKMGMMLAAHIRRQLSVLWRTKEMGADHVQLTIVCNKKVMPASLARHRLTIVRRQNLCKQTFPDVGRSLCLGQVHCRQSTLEMTKRCAQATTNTGRPWPMSADWCAQDTINKGRPWQLSIGGCRYSLVDNACLKRWSIC